MNLKDQYIFPITNQNKFLYTLVANILLFVNFTFYFLYQFNLFHSNQNTNLFIFFNSIVLLIIFLYRFYHVVTQRKKIFTSFHFSLVAVFLWSIESQWVLASILFVLGYFEFLINRHWYCSLSSKGITISTFPAKIYKWDQLSNVVLKNGVFTIDQKNNKIFQKDVSKEDIPFEESELQNFIKKYLP